MRKLVPLCLVTLAMTVSACGDDEGAVVPVDQPDGSADSTTKEDAGPDETSSGPSSSVGETSVAPETDGGGGATSAPDTVDAGGDGGGEPAPVDGGDVDSGVTSAPTGDGGSDVEVDAGDGGGGSELTACESACAKAEEVSGCSKFDTCEANFCDAIYNDGPNCIAEANDYLACIGTNGTAEEFTCNEEDEPAYSGVCDAYLASWFACAFPT